MKKIICSWTSTVSLLLFCLLPAGCSGRPEEPAPTPSAATRPAAPAAGAMPAQKITYQLPTDGAGGTYRVTLALTPVDEPDWIVSTFLCGGVRTVTEENQGRFEEVWNGLDENDMPLPPGDYRVKGIYMPAEKWKIDGRFHSVIPRYLMSVGDSWGPTPENDSKPPWIFGHQFGPISDLAVAPNGIGGFLAGYVESGRNPYLVDLKKPVGYDQVLKTFNSSGSAGGPGGQGQQGSDILAAERQKARGNTGQEPAGRVRRPHG